MGTITDWLRTFELSNHPEAADAYIQMNAAADRIASLEAENARLREQVARDEGDAATMRGFIATHGCTPSMMYSRAVVAERQLAEARALADERFTEIKRAQVIIDGLTTYRERLVTMPMQSTDLMRARLRELADQARDDFDRAVIAALDDLDALLARAALAPAEKPGSDDGLDTDYDPSRDM